MARTYDPSQLASPDVASLAWARAWVRMTLRDTPNEAGAYPPNSLLDEEIDGALALNSVMDASDPPVALYAPHVVAAQLVEGDPRRVLSFSVGGLSEALPDAKTVAAAIRKSGVGIEALITAAGGTPPSMPGRSIRRETVF
ncbi:MAG: hypothetical protein M0R28_21385 [Pigmentiphaga sp.]|nr:hypothetical protein [Pigmentiphaga sp.]